MALTLASGRRARRKARASAYLPVLLFLRDQAAALAAKPDLSLAEAVRSSVARQNGPVAPPGWFERQLEHGRCLVMLDGLDEVADPAACREVVAWVERQMAACGKNRFVVTSRPYGYRDNPVAGVTALEVCGFTGEQIEYFVRNWYLANEIMSAQKDDPGVRMKANDGAADLLHRVYSTPALSDLAVNPLLLTMIATVHRYRSSLPGRRVELYAEICDVFLGKRQQARGLDLDLTPAQKRSVLQPLAYYMMCKRQRMLPAEEAKSVIAGPLAQVDAHADPDLFLRLIENGSGLLVERENGLYGFSHLSFQEYLASVYACTARLGDELVTHVVEDWWRETIRLYAAQADATPIVAACLAEARVSVPALALAIECQDEALQLDPAQRAALSNLLDAGIEDPDPDRRRLIAETLLTLRTRRLTRLDDLREADDSLITHAEYQLFVDDMRAQGKYYQPDHWQSYQFQAGQGRQPVLGVRPSDAVAFCDWLTKRAGEGWRYRIPHAAELPLSFGSSPASAATRATGSRSNNAWTLEGRETLSLDDRASSYLDNAWDRARDPRP